jgi:transcriptional regulator with XRE-family HTH domain
MSDASQAFGQWAEEVSGDFHDIRGLLDALRKERLRRGLGLGEVSQRCGIDRATLSRFENGLLGNPTVQTLTRIAEALGVRLKWRVLARALPDASALKEPTTMDYLNDVLDSLNAPVTARAGAEATASTPPAAPPYDRNADLTAFVRDNLRAVGAYIAVYEDLAGKQLDAVRSLCFDRVTKISDAEAKHALAIMRSSLDATADHGMAEEWRRCLRAVAEFVLRAGPLTGPRAVLACEAILRLSGYFHHPVGLYAAFRPYARKLVELLFGQHGIDLPYLRITGGSWEEAAPEEGEFVTLWNFAGKDLARASRILCFIASSRSRFSDVYTTAERHEELRSRAARDDTVLYRWSVSSPSVELIAKSVAVRRKDLVEHLNLYGFDQNLMRNPDRRARSEWFNNIRHLAKRSDGTE